MSFQLAPKTFWLAELISQFFCYSNSSKDLTCPSGKLKTEFTGPIAKSTSPGLSDSTFFARCSLLKNQHSKFQFDQELYMKYHYVDVLPLVIYLFTDKNYICAHCSRSKQLSLFCLWFKLFWWDHSSCYRPIWWRCLPVPLVRFLVSKVLLFPIHSPESLQMDTSESWHLCLSQRCQRKYQHLKLGCVPLVIIKGCLVLDSNVIIYIIYVKNT